MIGEALLTAIRKEPNDGIWQEAILLSENIQTNYQAVLAATMTAVSEANHPDTFAALSTCLLEHILQHDFSAFDSLEAAVRGGDNKALYSLSLCAKFGASTDPQNSSRWDALRNEYRERLRVYRRMIEVD